MSDPDDAPRSPAPSGGSPSPRSSSARPGTPLDPDTTTGPAVLDASAVLAWLQSEPGAEVVQSHLGDAVVGAVNFAEIHQKLAQHGVDADRTTRLLRTLGVRVEPFDAADALTASRLWPATRAAGLSLGDRCCLAVAARLGGPAVTADIAWSSLEVGVNVVSIR